MFLTYKYRLLPNKCQHAALAAICESQRQLYNAALQERIDCYRKTAKSRSYIDQCKALTECRRDLPEMADYADEAGYALYLCGHTHGGQICLPGGRSLITSLRRCRHAASGLWSQGSMTGYISRGLGVSNPPIRFNTRGEVVLITLRR